MSLLVIYLLIGAFVSMIFWQAYSFFHFVPDEDRQFLDRPALGFRLTWPLIQALVHYFGKYISPTQERIISQRLRHAGAEYSVSAKQFIAAKIVSAAGFALVAFFLSASMGRSAGLMALVASFMGYFYPELWLREVMAKRQGEILRSLPFYLDIVTLSVEAGSNLTGGLTQAVQKSKDTALRSELSRVLRDIRAGKTRADSLRDLADRTGSLPIKNIVSGLIQAERTGSSLGPLLRAQADQLRSERFQRAEKRAMEAPVKLLGPLMMFIFPTTFLVLTFLVLSKALMQGVVKWAPIVWAYQWPGS